MLGWYSRWISAWEWRLANRDADRGVRPFEWGLDWLGVEGPTPDAARALDAAVRRAIENSGEFFSYAPPADFRERDGQLRFTSPIATPHPENNTVHADYLPAASPRGRAVVVLPQWNAGREAHIGLCRLLNRFGISALRMSKAYHGPRMPPELERADYHVSSNLGRTIQATRQSVIDARCCVDWLVRRGYSRLGILGTSLGSCVAFITAAHDPRLTAGAFNHVATNFGDVVWSGLATRHIRAALEGHISREALRRYWAVISPATYIDRLRERRFQSLAVWTKYDPVFLPEYSREFVRQLEPAQTRCLPCGHYTVGEFPFNWLDGLTICRFLSKRL